MRLIDADALQEVITQDWFLDILLTQNGKSDIAKKLTDMIDSVPLAYDVEKVVAELEDNCDIYSVKYYQENIDVKAVPINDAIDIVKSGGTDLGYNPYQE